MTEEIKKRMKNEDLYFENPSECIAIKKLKGTNGKIFAKFIGEYRFPEVPVAPYTPIVFETMSEGKVITREQYESY